MKFQSGGGNISKGASSKDALLRWFMTATADRQIPLRQQQRRHPFSFVPFDRSSCGRLNIPSLVLVVVAFCVTANNTLFLPKNRYGVDLNVGMRVHDADASVNSHSGSGSGSIGMQQYYGSNVTLPISSTSSSTSSFFNGGSWSFSSSFSSWGTSKSVFEQLSQSTPASSLDAIEADLLRHYSEAQQQLEGTASTSDIRYYDGTPYIQKCFSNVFRFNREDTLHRNANNDERIYDYPDDIVLISHISMQRIDVLRIQQKWWHDGPISVAVYVSTRDHIAQLVAFWKELSQALPATIALRRSQWISFHVVMEVSPSDQSLAYPHNVLRNVALDHVRTLSQHDQSHSKQQQQQQRRRYFFVAIDVDFIPSWYCHQELQRLLKDDGDENPLKGSDAKRKNMQATTVRQELLHNHRMMVLPAFALRERKARGRATDHALPHATIDLFDKLKSDDLHSFHKKRFPEGHGPTNFTRWTSLRPTLSHTDRRLWYPIQYAMWFEPYLLGVIPNDKQHVLLPRYFEDFRGYGMNKVAWVLEVHLSNYKFGVLPPTVWVVHVPHVSSVSNRQTRINQRTALPRFEAHLKQTYGYSNGVAAAPKRGG